MKIRNNKRPVVETLRIYELILFVRNNIISEVPFDIPFSINPVMPKVYFNFISTLITVITVLWGGNAYSQNDSISTQQLKPIVIQSARLPTSLLESPFSISAYSATKIQGTKQQLSLKEYVDNVPGLFVMNANNYAQDLRISIRGFGARAAFGIRGVKLIVDGIPETTPDGQGQIDNLNLNTISKIEILKGPSSSMYGNASGGVIQIESDFDIENNFIAAGFTAGSFGLNQYQLRTGLTNDQTQLMLAAGHVSVNGYRAQSKLVSTNASIKMNHQWSDASNIRLLFNYTNSPVAEDPGALVLAEVNEDRTQARSRNVDFATRESIGHLKTGVTYDWDISEQFNLNTYAFYSNRDFEGKLPFTSGGIVGLNRNYYGQGASFQSKLAVASNYMEMKVGYDFSEQQDLRQRFDNIQGEQGPQTMNQNEKFTNLGIYFIDHFYFSKLLFSLGLRYDFNRIGVDDMIGINTSSTDLKVLTPSIGVNYTVGKTTHIYSNYRRSFETPSLSELSANPDGSTGLNNLDPQKAVNYEIGVKGQLTKNIKYDLTAFRINTKDELVPYELASLPGRTFYRNAGATVRNGVEFSGVMQLNPNWSVGTSYTYSDFSYESFEIDDVDFESNLLPGIPKHFGSIMVSREAASGIVLNMKFQMTGSFFADNGNQTQIKGYGVLDISVAHEIEIGKGVLLPFFGINNVLNEQYYDNIRLNGFGGRYYEPAAGVNIYGGLRYRWENSNTK